MRTETIAEGVTLYLGDSREILPTLGKVDAVVTDPPYGVGMDAALSREGGTQYGVTEAARRMYEATGWDSDPIPEDLMELVRAAGRYNIIFGGNYYNSAPSSCWLVWDKENGANKFADCELAWTNLRKPVRRLRFIWNGMIRAHGEPRGDHPTQKPVGVMKWCIEQLPADCVTIIDPFMGSGTTGVAAVQMGKNFTGIERHEKYFYAACRRVAEATRQGDMLIESPKLAATEQLDMLNAQAKSWARANKPTGDPSWD